MRGLIVDVGGVLASPAGSAVESLLGDARRSGVRTAIASNDPGGAGAEPLRALAGSLVDVVVLSGDVGEAKPDAAIYRRVAALLDLPPRECVFVDDLPANVAGAAAVGMAGVLFDADDAAAALAEVATLLTTDTGGDDS
ncbi:HAD family hydrolase [Rhodococcus rhodnii]|uniref:Hydrolase n=2 Tax=Rhodococcus rhodnii TaxID=38312 RepID=R7WN05_9NOCA|nr:HAD-IA family hydrolase [Rhodococcus rhodnii]EOM75364.1 hypothetical protein Rrhod_3162 [Rhodococcus rhodnii LMG 5362]TXG90588.1 HAD family hydrolase [Rhodococcus rhodnii]